MSLAGSNRKPALTAAASKIAYSKRAAEKIKEADWQQRAWQVYELEGSIYFMTRYRSAVARKIDYFAASVESSGDDPDRDAEYNDDGELISLGAAAKVLEVEGGPELIRRLVSELMVHWDVPGEGYLTRFEEEPFWRILSTQELKKSGGAYSWGDDDNKMGTITPDQVYRVWKAHPRFHWEADSPTKHVLEDAEELILLRRELKARSNSRLPAGVLLLPDSIDLSPFADDEDGTPDDIARWLTDLLAEAVRDPGSTRSLAPTIMTMHGDDIAKVRWLTFDREWDINLEQRSALLRSIATGLDVPPEILTGMADLNHWSAWLVSEQAVSQHVAPTVDDILDSLTTNWFKPLLEAAMVDPERYVLWRDLSPATVAPDVSDLSIRLFQEGIISDVTVRRNTNHDEADAPEIVEGQVAAMDADELLKRINAFGTLRRAGAEWEDAVRAVGLPPIEQIPGLLPITVRAEEVVKNEEAVVSALADLQEGDPPLARAAVTAATRRRIVASELADIDAELLTWVQGQADMEIERLTKLALSAAVDPLDDSLLTGLAGKLDAKIAEAQEAARSWLSRTLGRTPSDAGESLARSQGVQVIIGGILEAVRRKLFTPGGAPDPIELGQIGNITTPTQAIRHGLSLAGGGPAVYEDGKAAELIGNGQHVHDELAEDGFFQDGYVWKYGHPANTFEPHLHLDGKQFTSWDDPQLAVGFGDSWLRRSHYAPGDHKGCCCAFIQVIIQGSTPETQLGIRPDEVAPIGPLLNWDQFAAKLPTNAAQRELINGALQRLNGLPLAMRDRYIELLRRFNGRIDFQVATQSTTNFRFLGKFIERQDGAARHTEMMLHLSRESQEWIDWMDNRNDFLNQFQGADGSFSNIPFADKRPPKGWPLKSFYTTWDVDNPAPKHWRLATPDELADTLIHELGHANDFHQRIETGTSLRDLLPNQIQVKVNRMFEDSGRSPAYEYATSEPAEMVAELHKFYLRGVYGEDISLTALEWRAANPEIALWIEENIVP